MKDGFEFAASGMDKITDINQMSPLVLAYIGDAVFDLFVRTRIVGRRMSTVNRLHNTATGYVKAAAQARIAKSIHDSLTEEERYIFRRGRNAKSSTVPRNADPGDYHMATAFEAVIGFLYLNRNRERLEQLLSDSVKIIETER